jgi:adenylate cyclase
MYRLSKKFKKQLLITLISLVIMSVFMAYARGSLQWGFLKQLENILYDARVALTMPRTKDERIVIVDIDEKSLAQVGRWPWGRDRLAHLVTQLFDYYHITLIGFDIYFRESDESSGIRILEQLAKTEFAGIPSYLSRLDSLRQTLDFDQLFVDSMMKGPVVLGYTFFSEGEVNADIRGGQLPPPAIPAGTFKGKNVHAPHASGYGVNLQKIQASAVASGHTSRGLDEDSVVRRVPMLMEFDGNYYESLALAIARYLLIVDQIEPVFSGGHESADTELADIVGLRLGDHFIPVDVNLQALVPYRGKRYSYPYISAIDVMQGRIPVQDLQNKIVLVGTSAKGLVDLRQSPVDREFPGVEIHANLISGILDQTIKQRSAQLWWIEYLQLFLLGVLLALILPRLSPIGSMLITVTFLSLVVMLNLYFWHYVNLVTPLASSLLLILTLFLINMLYGFFVERRGRQQLTSLFGQYVPSELVNEMSEDPQTYTQGAQTREMSVLFSDIRGFTNLSEGLSAADLSELMNLYLTPMTRLIHDNRGTIDKYMGDAIMAFWGAPLQDPNHARHAVDAGLNMLERLKGIQEIFNAKGWPEIHIGVGINTGMMSVGDMGSEFRMAYTVLGDAVNLGSRLEGLTKAYGVEIIVGEATRAAVDDYVFCELDLVRVKGKDQPVSIYEPLAPFEEVSAAELEEIDRFHACLQHYRRQDWETAAAGLHELQRINPDRLLYALYQQRIAVYKQTPPGPEWDGVYIHETK